MTKAMTPDANDGTTLPRAIARLIEYAPGRHAALPPYTTVEVLENPSPVAVPGAPPYACGLLDWQGHFIPMMDLHRLLNSGGSSFDLAVRYALVVAWQREPGAPVEHGALALTSLPETVDVADDACCALPRDNDAWRELAASCFSVAGQPVPVLDTRSLFGRHHA